MPKFMRKPLEVQAYQWQGAMPDILPGYLACWETAVDEDTVHALCGNPWRAHAVTTDAKHLTVCPGQWAVQEPNKDVRVLTDADFRNGYDPAVVAPAARRGDTGEVAA